MIALSWFLVTGFAGIVRLSNEVGKTETAFGENSLSKGDFRHDNRASWRYKSSSWNDSLRWVLMSFAVNHLCAFWILCVLRRNYYLARWSRMRAMSFSAPSKQAFSHGRCSIGLPYDRKWTVSIGVESLCCHHPSSVCRAVKLHYLTGRYVMNGIANQTCHNRSDPVFYA